MFMSVATRSAGAILKNSFRSFSVPAVGNGIRDRMRKFIIENPHLISTETSNLNLPAVKELTQTQKELLKQIEQIDLDSEPYKVNSISPKNSKEEPTLIMSKDVRQLTQCICDEDDTFFRSLVLYRGLPQRCYCGYWFKLVDPETFEAARNKKWECLKNKPRNVELMKQFEEAQDKMNVLLEKGKTMTTKSPNVNDFLVEMNTQWKSLLSIYKKIRKVMEVR